MDTDGSGTAPEPAPHGSGRISNPASSALAAISIVLVLLFLFSRFIWQYRKHQNGSSSAAAAAATSSYAMPPACTSTTLPVFVLVESAAVRGHGAEKVDCAVCLAELGDGETAARLVPGCGHGFHSECIEAWFRVNSTCPLCRAAVAAVAAGQGAGEALQSSCSSSL